MQLKTMISLMLLSFFLNGYSQESFKTNFNKFIIKNYTHNNSLNNYCKNSVAVIYVDIKENKVVNIYSDGDLGNLIVPDLKFIEKYNFNFVSNKKLGIFFIIKNVTAICVDVKIGFNENALIIEKLLKEIDNNNTVTYLFNPIEILIGNAQK